jgi:hypothetical protein
LFIYLGLLGTGALGPVCLLENIFFKKNYFPMFGSVMENKLENIFQYLVMS